MCSVLVSSPYFVSMYIKISLCPLQQVQELTEDYVSAASSIKPDIPQNSLGTNDTFRHLQNTIGYTISV